MKTVTIEIDDEVYEFFKNYAEKISAEVEEVLAVEDVLAVELYNCYRKRSEE